MFDLQNHSKTETADRPLPDCTASSPEKELPKQNPIWQSLALGSFGIQAKLTVSQPGDVYEQEADRVADRVMRMATPPGARYALELPAVAGLQAQRKCAPCEEEEKQVRLKVRGSNEIHPATAPAVVAEVLNSPGRALDENTRAFMEPRLGYDFSGVRVHDDAPAATSAAALNASAYTLGSHIAFAAGAFSPNADAGRKLLAHELVHTIQQHEHAPATVHRKPDDKPKVVPATIDNVDELYGALTEDVAKDVFTAYGSPLKGNEKELISAFVGHGHSAWMGLAIIKQESSFCNKDNNPSIDERNIANPFSVHFNGDLKKWPKGCGKNLLLIADQGKEYVPSKDVKKDCAAKDFRLTTFAESANASAKTMAKLKKEKAGIDAYREEPGYKKDLNSQLNDILKKIKAKRK